ncbi:hypothetical protein D3C80_1702330 [compost metagenome]
MALDGANSSDSFFAVPAPVFVVPFPALGALPALPGSLVSSPGFQFFVALYSFSLVLGPATPSAFIPNSDWNHFRESRVLDPKLLSSLP